MGKPIEQRTHAKSVNRNGVKRTRSTTGRTQNSKIGNQRIGQRCFVLVKGEKDYTLKREDRDLIDGVTVFGCRREIARKIGSAKLKHNQVQTKGEVVKKVKIEN